MNHSNGSDLSFLVFHTHNVAKALKPSVDGELAHAIHETLHFALDGDPQDYTLPRSNGHPCSADEQEGQSSTSASVQQNDEEFDQIRPGFFESNVEERPFISFAWEQDKGTLLLPHPRTVANPILDPCTNPEEGFGARDAFDVTSKFFFLSKGQNTRYPEEWIEEAMSRFATATGLDTVDTLILSFGGTKENGDAMNDKVQSATRLWKQLSPNEQILSMGLSDFSQSTLQSFIEELELSGCEQVVTKAPRVPEVRSPKSSITSHVQESLSNQGKDTSSTDLPSPTHVHIPSSPSKAVFTELATEEDGAWKEYGPSQCRRPRLCTINLKESTIATGNINGNGTANTSGSCCWDRGLSSYCKEHNILLVNHSDRKDLIPARTLPTLMKEFENKMPYRLPSSKKLEPLWCFKYTVLIRDRGVLADKGFLLYTQVVDV